MHSSTVKRSKWPGLLGLLVLIAALFPAYGSERVTYFHWDAQGSPIAATDETGNVIWREEYRPFGARIKQEPTAASNTRWYTGHPHDEDTGLSYMGARYYDPVMGRFMGVDPKGFSEDNLHSFNRYAYANNNPYKYIDPDGNFPIETVIDAGFVIYDVGRFLGAGIAYTVGAFTGNEALTATALEGLQETSIDLGASATGFVIPYVPATVTRSLTKVPRGITNWGNSKTLADHFTRHGKHFGAKSAGDYARQASDFLKQSQKRGLPTKIGPDGTIRVYDPKTNTFGAYNPDGTTKTFFKPSSPTYWDRQPGSPPWTPSGG